MKLNKTQQSFLIVVLLILSLVIGLYLIKQPQQLQSRAFQPKGTVALQLNTASVNIATGSAVEAILQMDTGDANKVTGVDVTVKYNENLNLTGFELDSASGLDKTVLSSFDPNARSFHLIAVNNSGSISGSGLVNIGKLKLTAPKAGAGVIEITDEPILTAAAQAGKLTLIKTDRPNLPPVYAGLTYNIGGTVSVTPTLGPTSTVTPTGTFPQCVNGDVGDNGCVDNTDFGEWFKEFTGMSADKNARNELKADFYPVCQGGKRGDGVINGADLNIWIKESGGANKCK